MPSSQKTLSKPRRFNLALGAPLLLVSLALHSVVLSLPMPGQETDQENAPVEIGNTAEPQAIKVVKFPSNPPPKQQAAQPSRLPAKARLAPQTSPTAVQPAAPAPAQPQAPAPKPPEEAPSAPAQQPPEPPADPPSEPPSEPLPAEPPPLTLAQRLQDPTAYAYNNRTKSAEVGIQDFLGWYNSLSKDVYGDPMPGSNSIEPLRIQYPLNTCLVAPPELGRLGVVVDAVGAVISQPEILASTGYDVLDEQALAAVTHYTFPTTGKVTAYGLPIEVEYDAATCVAPSK
ncbi:MAG TPA: hypothetical protein V6D29_01990 [Leptolyngbyaceae cyanobacterium]